MSTGVTLEQHIIQVLLRPKHLVSPQFEFARRGRLPSDIHPASHHCKPSISNTTVQASRRGNTHYGEVVRTFEVIDHKLIPSSLSLYHHVLCLSSSLLASLSSPSLPLPSWHPLPPTLPAFPSLAPVSMPRPSQTQANSSSARRPASLLLLNPQAVHIKLELPRIVKRLNAVKTRKHSIPSLQIELCDVPMRAAYPNLRRQESIHAVKPNLAVKPLQPQVNLKSLLSTLQALVPPPQAFATHPSSMSVSPFLLFVPPLREHRPLFSAIA
ncbi:hypothetical protein B0H11DRAFT_2306303 [Mycena galericulata]|nr:hypothetical protein B0H11DRAFT_2306303 [Mycena galericulata]